MLKCCGLNIFVFKTNHSKSGNRSELQVELDFIFFSERLNG